MCGKRTDAQAEAVARTPPPPGKVLSAQDIVNLRNYKYHGKDLSLSYKYFLSPLAEKCLVFVPKARAIL
jgi:hypothetical protein